MKFWNTLFNPTENICLTDTVFGVHTEQLYTNYFMKIAGNNYFCINPLNGNRCDANVGALRNILIEIDKGTIEAQKAFIIDSKVPYTSIVFSGKKSIHVIISLQESLKTIEEYKNLTKRIYNKLGGKDFVDTSVGNPSRLSRTPGAMRDGVEQRLLYLGTRIPNKELLDWLGPELTIVKSTIKTKAPKRILSGFTNYFLAFGAVKGEWNISLFNAVCDMTRARYERDEIISMCEAVTGTLDASDRRTIDSAIKTATSVMND